MVARRLPKRSLCLRNHHRPAEHAPGFLGAQVLIVDLVARLVAHLRLEIRTHQPENTLDEIVDGDLRFVREVEGLAPESRIRAQPLGEQQVGGGTVVDVEVVAHVAAIRANHRALAAHDGTNGAGYDAVPVEVARAIEVPATRYGHWRREGPRAGLCDEVRA